MGHLSRYQYTTLHIKEVLLDIIQVCVTKQKSAQYIQTILLSQAIY